MQHYCHCSTGYQLCPVCGAILKGTSASKGNKQLDVSARRQRKRKALSFMPCFLALQWGTSSVHILVASWSWNALPFEVLQDWILDPFLLLGGILLFRRGTVDTVLLGFGSFISSADHFFEFSMVISVFSLLFYTFFRFADGCPFKE